MSSDKLFTIPALQSLFAKEPLRSHDLWARRCRSSIRFRTWTVSLYNFPQIGAIVVRRDSSTHPQKACSHFTVDSALVSASKALAPGDKLAREQWIMAFVMASCIASPQRRGRWFGEAKGMMQSIEVALVARAEQALLGAELATPSLGIRLPPQSI